MRAPGIGEQWWLWTGLGVVLAGGVAGGIAWAVNSQTMPIPNMWGDAVEAIRVRP
jgi:hypothetical protein